MENLHSKRFLSDPSCPLCSSASESILHALWSCSAAVAVWQEARRKFQKMVLWESDGAGFLEQLVEKLDGEDLVEALILARYIWLRRNYVVFNNIFTSPANVAQQARELSNGRF
jgi:hypothetical protein